MMGELRSMLSSPRLDLTNFSHAAVPRTRGSCAGVGVKPVQLLIKSLNELIAKQKETPVEAMRVMHESYERERRKLLKMCRDETDRIIHAEGKGLPGSKKASGIETAPYIRPNNDPGVHKSTGNIPCRELCCKGRSACRSCPGHSDLDRSATCSFSLGDLRPSPATEMQLEKLTRDIKRKMCVTVSEQDRKIAALMLERHREEQDRLRFSKQVEEERQRARRKEEAQWAQSEKRRRKKLIQSMQRWNEELEARRRLRVLQDKDKAQQLRQEVLLQEDRWRRLKEEVEAQSRAKRAAAQKEAEERKSSQKMLLRQREEEEKKQRESKRQVSKEREHKARQSKVFQEMEEKRRLQEENNRLLLRHILLKRQMDQHVEEMKAQRRSTLETKLQHSCEKRAQALNARLWELRDRTAQEKRQIERVQLKAKLQRIQQLAQKQSLVKVSQQRMERAAQHTSAQRKSRAQQAYWQNKHRQVCHQKLRERLQREEEALRKVRESCITMKECRRERLRQQREQIQEEAYRQARASFHMREQVRQQTQSHTFAQMALEAQLTASISRMKL